MNLGKYYKDEILRGLNDNTPTVWVIVRDNNQVPIDIAECKLMKITSGFSGVTCMYFSDGNGLTPFTYDCHMNDDWYATGKEAMESAWNSLTNLIVQKKREIEAIEIIQHHLSHNRVYSSN